MLHEHKFCVYKGKRKVKLLITCENFVLSALYQFLFCFVNIFRKCGKESLQSDGFREGRQVTVNATFFCFSPKWFQVSIQTFSVFSGTIATFHLYYRKTPKYPDTRKIAVIILKFE